MEQRPPEHVFLVFVGPIHHPATKNLRNVCCTIANNGARKLTLFLSSPGGANHEGFALYHFLKALPLELHVHNMGSVESIANIVFLAGDIRTASLYTRFMMHDFSWTFGQEALNRVQIKERAESLGADARRFMDICAHRTRLGEAEFESRQLLTHGTIFGPEEAKDLGIVQDVTDLRIPAGATVINVDYQ